MGNFEQSMLELPTIPTPEEIFTRQKEEIEKLKALVKYHEETSDKYFKESMKYKFAFEAIMENLKNNK